MKILDDHRRRVILTDGTSKINKLHLAIGWKDRGWFLEYKWDRINDQVRFQFEPDGPWIESKCFDDVLKSMKGGDEKK